MGSCGSASGSGVAVRERPVPPRTRTPLPTPSQRSLPTSEVGYGVRPSLGGRTPRHPGPQPRARQRNSPQKGSLRNDSSPRIVSRGMQGASVSSSVHELHESGSGESGQEGDDSLDAVIEEEGEEEEEEEEEEESVVLLEESSCSGSSPAQRMWTEDAAPRGVPLRTSPPADIAFAQTLLDFARPRGLGVQPPFSPPVALQRSCDHIRQAPFHYNP
eukprot:Hpha_TRINITY_DN6361_c0_g1::TRINITY_DN6361_c0_g1_i1::g.145619::m.145619